MKVISNAHRVLATVLLGLVPYALAWSAFAARSQAAPAKAPRASANGSAGGTVATVGSKRISRAEFDRAAKDALAQYQKLRNATPGEEIQRLIQRQALERLIRANMLSLEARKSAIAIRPEEIEAEFRKHPFFNQGGQFNEARYQKVKTANSAEYRATLAQIREDLGSHKLAQRLETQFTPDPAKLRADVEREFTRATLDYLALRIAEISGTYAEPREQDILDYYRAHQRDFERVQRAELSVIQIGEPLGERGRSVGDSLIEVMRRGTTFEGASAAYGGSRTRILVTPTDFPSYWQGDAAVSAQVFRQAPGSVLEQPVPGRDGWLVVRVDAMHPAGVAPLREVSREIRRLLRETSRIHASDKDLRSLYEKRQSMLRTVAYKVRYAVVDPARVAPGKPRAADLEEYYRGHLADYSSYDAASASIRSRPLAEVRSEVEARWSGEHRAEQARELASKLESAWRQGRRDRALESGVQVLDRGPLPVGAPVDTGLAGQIVGDSLAARGGALGTGVTVLDGGATLVFQIYQAIRDFAPTFEEYRPTLEREVEVQRQQDEEKQAHAVFDRDPARWAGGNAVHFQEIELPFLSPLNVPLTHKEVERFHLTHIDRYSAPEEIRARHILVSPKGPGAADDAEARRQAENILRRLKAGEDFAELARRYSEDEPTRAKGGDLGFFGHGAMLEGFERAAFALKPGETSDLVKTEAGYHIIKLVDRLPQVAEPLVHVYPNVGSDAAADKAQRMAEATAESLLYVCRTPAQLRAAAKKLHLNVVPRDFNIAEVGHLPREIAQYVAGIAKLEPGTILRRSRSLKGVGTRIAWLDSIGPARAATWEQVQDRVLDEFRNNVARRVLEAKRAELDSMTAAGWSLDSLATLWGGFEHVTGVTPGKGIVGLGRGERVDSLVFGGARAPALAVGETSQWVVLARGVARVRLLDRVKPGVDLIAAKIDGRRRLAVERRLQDYFGRLESTYPVRILDPDLSQVTLPPLPETAP